MRIITSTQWILALLLFFTSNFVTQAQTLDATFSSPLTNQCAGGLFTLNATTTTYQGYTWTIEGPNNFSSTISGSSSALNLTEPGTYNVSLSVTDGVITTNNSVSGYLNVATPAIANAGVNQTICANSSVTLNGSVGGSATSMSWSGGTGTFSTNSSQVTTYTPSLSETGIVNLILTTNDPAGPCAAVSDTVMIIINQVPTVTAPASICDGSTGQLSPTIGGTWVSNNTSRAAVTNSGIVVGVASGNVTFTFVDTLTGCSNTTSTVTINSNPIFTLSKTDPTTCNGTNGTINILGLTPNTSYQYSYALSNISTGPITATSNSTGQITILGLGVGTYTLVISLTSTGCQSATQNITLVNPNAPDINDIQDQVLCGTTYSLPAITGTNLTGNQAYYTGPNGTGSVISTGTVISTTSTIYMYTSTIGGCIDEESFTVTIHSQPTVSAPTSLCVGSTAQLSPSSGGTWTSNNTSRATINNFGIITGIAAGNVTFSYADNSTGCIGTTTVVTIVDQFVSMTSSTVCVNGTVQLTPSTGGTWVSNNPSIASVTNDGLVTGLAQGTATFTFTNSTTGCSKTTQNLNVGVGTNPVLSVPTAFCDQTSVQLLPSSGGTWTSNMLTVASVTNNGIALGTISGFVTFTYVNTVTGCSATSSPVEVYGLQQVSMPNSQLCVNSTMQLSPNSGGTWVSSNPNIASITNDGLVTSLSQGTVNFTFTNSTTGCAGTTYNLTVNPLPIITLSSNTVCVNSLIQISTNNQGNTFNISNPSVASFGSNGITGIAEGTFIIAVMSPMGCMTTSEQITVTSNATVNPIPNQIVCAGDSTTPITFSGSAQQYNWTNDNTSTGLAASGIGNIAGFVATNPTATNQISILTVTPINSSCNSTPTTFTITVKPIPTVFTPPNQTLCHNDSTFAISFSGAINGTDYNWTNSNSSIGYVNSGTGNIPSFQVQNTTFGSQIANFVVTPSLNGCLGSSMNFDITVLPLPIVNAGNDTTLCFGESFTPIVTGNASTFIWNNGLVYNTPFTPTFTNTYTVIGSNNTCYNSDSITVTVNSVPQLTISTFDGEDSLACDGTLSVLVTDGTAPYSYTWTNGALNYTTSAIQDLCSGTYSLAVVDANGCSATNFATINDTLIENVLGDTLIFTDNIYQDSTIIGADTSAWIENCTFDYSLVTGATIDSYIDSGDSTIVTWIVALSTGTTVSVDATYFMSPGTTGVYDLTLQLYCSAKSGPKFLVASSRLYYEASSIGIQSLSLNSVFLYPNPTTSTISISGINSDFSYKISDLQGKLLKQGVNDKQIEIENLPAGTYVIGISTDIKVKQFRIVKI